MKRRLLSLALALVMCLSLLPAAAFAAEGSTEVKEATLHYDLPKAGRHPRTGMAAGGNGYSVEIQAWEDSTDFGHPEEMSEEDVFQPGRVYTVQVAVTAQPGYTLAEDMKVCPPQGFADKAQPGHGVWWYSFSYALPETTEDVAFNEENFPDANFRRCIRESYPEQCADDVLTPPELLVMDMFSDNNPAEDQRIQDLTGLEYFTNLTMLGMSWEAISEVDLQSFPRLTWAYLSGNQLTELDVSQNPRLVELSVGDNDLQTLNLRGSTGLMVLGVARNRLTELETNTCDKLEYLNCADNQIRKLDLHHTRLTELDCAGNPLTELDLRYLPRLEEVQCSVKTLDITSARNLRSVSFRRSGAATMLIPAMGIPMERLGIAQTSDILSITGGTVDAMEAWIYFDDGSEEIRVKTAAQEVILRQGQAIPEEETAWVDFVSERDGDYEYLESATAYADENDDYAASYPIYAVDARNNRALGWDVWATSGQRGRVGYFGLNSDIKLPESGRYEAILCWEFQLSEPDLGVSVQESSGKPYLRWSEVDGAVKYEVEFTTDDGTYTPMYSTKGTSVRHGSAPAGVMCTYRVRGIDANGNPGRWSYDDFATGRCAVPELTTGIRSDGKPVLTWNEVEGAAGYRVMCARDDGDYEELKTIRGTRLTHGSAQYGSTYYYMVQAITADGSGDSELSEPQGVVVNRQGQLEAPRLTASNKRTTGKPYLKWDKIDGAAKYEVYRATSKGGKYTRLWSGSGTALTNGSAKAGTTYYYKVRAVGADGTKGPWSEIKTRTCDLAQPDVKITRRSDGKPVLTWKKIDGAVKYEVYRRVDGGSFSRLSTVSGTKLTNSSAKSGHTYTYKVRAIAKKSAANSSYSYYDTVKVK